MVNMLAAASAALFAALSAAPMSTAQEGQCRGAFANPEVYNFELDGHPAKVIRDASTGPIPTPGFFIVDESIAKRALERRFLPTDEIVIDFNVLYVDLDGEGLLVDTGNGANNENSMLLEHLENEGITADSIKHILITHGHGDHIVGLVDDLESLTPRYPEATVYINRIEFEYWTTDPADFGTSLRTEEDSQAAFDNARAVFDAISDQIQLFETDEEPVPGFQPILTTWHTPGHTSYLVNDGDKKFLVAGDPFFHKVLTIENPWVGTGAVDFSSTEGPAGRYALLDRIANGQWQVLGYHAQFPGLLFVDRCGSNFLTTLATYEGSSTAMAVCTDSVGSYGDN